MCLSAPLYWWSVVVVVSGRQRCDLAGTGIDRGRIDHAALVEQPRERALPVLVVDVFVSGGGAGRPASDLVAEVRAEVGPGEDAALVQRHRHAEQLAFPGRGEHQLPVAARRRRRPFAVQFGSHPASSRGASGALTTPMPTIASRVTS